MTARLVAVAAVAVVVVLVVAARPFPDDRSAVPS
jgi:hypothetical protein